jgi:glycine/D-amino acid oxidase-like deaminating enzyme
VTIIGGGVIGCKVACHLAKRGWTGVVLLEKHKLTSGTSWHTAGLVVTSGFTSETSMELAKYTRDLYAGPEQETGYATGFEAVGLLQIAANQGVLTDLRRKVSFNQLMGIDSQEISAKIHPSRWVWAHARIRDRPRHGRSRSARDEALRRVREVGNRNRWQTLCRERIDPAPV